MICLLIFIERESIVTDELLFISHDMIEIMYNYHTINSTELSNLIESINKIYFDIRYPSLNFEGIYSEIIKLKNKIGNKTNMSILYKLYGNTNGYFANNKEINILRLDKNVKNIKHYRGSFAGCSSLIRVSISSSTISIGKNAFSLCSSLTSVSIPSSVTSIGENVFKECSSLTNVSILSSVTSIGKNAFSGCSSLKTVSIPQSIYINNLRIDSSVNVTKI